MTPLQLAQVRIQKLEADVERLTFELRDARSQVAAERDMQIECALRRQSGMTPQAAFVLTQLYNTRRTMTAALLLDILPSQDRANDRELKMISVVVHRLRARIGIDKVDTRGGGYAITEAGVAAVEAALRGAWIGHGSGSSDMRARARHLTPEQVREVRASGKSVAHLSRQFKLPPTAISRILAGSTYKDVI